MGLTALNPSVSGIKRGAQIGPLRVVVVDRDRVFLRPLAAHMTELGWRLTIRSGPATAESLAVVRPHAVLIDIDALGPRWDGWLARHAPRLGHVGLLVCTGRSSVKQRVRGLDAGADDWITKPCAVEEVAARVWAVVRRRRPEPTIDENALHEPISGLDVRHDRFDAFVDDKPVGLTRREFEVLLCLARREGRVLSRDWIYRDVWGYTMARGDRALDTTIRKIRAKLRRTMPRYEYIHTHRGVGYRFARERSRSRG